MQVVFKWVVAEICDSNKHSNEIRFQGKVPQF